MEIYVSAKTFYTKGFDGDKEVITGVIPGLAYSIIKEADGLVSMKNISTDSVIIITNDMLNSALFVNKKGK